MGNSAEARTRKRKCFFPNFAWDARQRYASRDGTLQRDRISTDVCTTFPPNFYGTWVKAPANSALSARHLHVYAFPCARLASPPRWNTLGIFHDPVESMTANGTRAELEMKTSERLFKSRKQEPASACTSPRGTSHTGASHVPRIFAGKSGGRGRAGNCG